MSLKSLDSMAYNKKGGEHELDFPEKAIKGKVKTI